MADYRGFKVEMTFAVQVYVLLGSEADRLSTDEAITATLNGFGDYWSDGRRDIDVEQAQSAIRRLVLDAIRRLVLDAIEKRVVYDLPLSMPCAERDARGAAEKAAVLAADVAASEEHYIRVRVVRDDEEARRDG